MEDLFSPPPENTFRDSLRSALQPLAENGIYLGTSSWKYEGWLEQIYTPERYQWQGKFSQARFNRTCLAEYAEVFPTVCVDAAYYQFPTEKYLHGLLSLVPSTFLFSFKVTDDITVKRFPKLPRFGPRGGQSNPHFLNAAIFRDQFLRPLETHRDQVGLLIFEFSHFYEGDFARGREFVEQLDAFFSQLPPGWQYAVEIRNRSFLHPDYFNCLRRYGAAHLYNQWTKMPPITEQLSNPLTDTTDFSAARFLLKSERPYQEAVDRFSPYQTIQEKDFEGRNAARKLIQRTGKDKNKRPSFLYFNNRWEGNSPQSIAAVVAPQKSPPTK